MNQNISTSQHLETLQQQLRTRMQEKNISATELERQAGLRMSAVRNILKGLSKKPSAESLMAIAKVFGCSVEELFGSQAIVSQDPFQTETDHSDPIEDLALIAQSVNVIHDLVKNKNKKLTFGSLSFLMREIYLYAMKNSSPEVDVKFAEWLIEKKLGS